MPFSSHSRYTTLDQTPPSTFRQGTSAFSKLIFFCSLAMFLMVTDVRFQVMQPLRAALATVLYPLQWVIVQPVDGVQFLTNYFQTLDSVQRESEQTHRRLTEQMQKTSVVEQLQLENHRLRQLLELKQRPETSGVAAQVLYDAADPYTRKVVIDKGTHHNIVAGSAVVDELGVVGQVTRTYWLTSEVTLLTDRDQAIPVLNTRTGARSVAYGDSLIFGGMLELRFMAANADVQTGDLLTTSGIDGIYPAGLPVAKIEKIERRADTAFAKIQCMPVAKMGSTSHVMVLQPIRYEVPNTLVQKPASKTSALIKANKP